MKKQRWINVKAFTIRRMLIILMIPAAVAMVSLNSCDELEGEQGPEGPAGPAGDDGSMIYAGNGTPSSALGEEGDFYLDQSTAALYGPKDEDGWGSPVNLQGPSGDDGNEILSGNGVPSGTLGREGDFYLDKDSYDLYGPKTASGWGTPVNLKGTANVIYSGWFEAGGYTNSGTQSAYVQKTAPAISQEIIDEGVVLAYTKLISDNGFVRPLPATTYDINDAIWNYVIPGAGAIRFTVKTIDGGNISPAGTNQYRYVIIPGGVSINKKETLKQMPYKEIKKRFGLQD